MDIEEKVFKKTGDKFIDSIIKFTIYNPVKVVLLSNIIIFLSLLIYSIMYMNAWLFLLSFFIYLIFSVWIFVFSDFADNLFDKKLYSINHKYKYRTYFVYLYEYTNTLTND